MADTGLTALLALSVVRYGQMTAGSYCYIGPQGIVHGTVVRDRVMPGIRGWEVGMLGVDSELPPPSLQLTVLNAGRRYLGVEDLAGKVFVTSGLGGMSGAQAKASVIVGCIGVIAEVSTPGTPSPHPCPPRSFLIPEALTLTLTPVSLSRPLDKASKVGSRAAYPPAFKEPIIFRGHAC